jgi:phosphoribosylformylglycinamidine synthase
LLLLQVRVAVIREEGSNGDREMAAAVFAAGMEPWDITMSDLINGRAQLDSFRGIIFVGGFSYADVLDSAKGWAATIRFNDRVLKQFQVCLGFWGEHSGWLSSCLCTLHLDSRKVNSSCHPVVWWEEDTMP